MKVGDVIFYKAGNTWFEKMIKFVTRSEYVHVACCLGKIGVIEAVAKGVIVRKPYSMEGLVMRHKTATQHQLFQATNFMISKVGAKYDFLGIGGILLNFLGVQRGKNFLDDKGRFWCSELVADGFIKAGIGINVDSRTFKVSPADLMATGFFKVVQQ